MYNIIKATANVNNNNVNVSTRVDMNDQITFKFSIAFVWNSQEWPTEWNLTSKNCINNASDLLNDQEAIGFFTEVRFQKNFLKKCIFIIFI